MDLCSWKCLCSWPFIGSAFVKQLSNQKGKSENTQEAKRTRRGFPLPYWLLKIKDFPFFSSIAWTFLSLKVWLIWKEEGQRLGGTEIICLQVHTARSESRQSQEPGISSWSPPHGHLSFFSRGISRELDQKSGATRTQTRTQYGIFQPGSYHTGA